jgi:hypothetical protein
MNAHIRRMASGAAVILAAACGRPGGEAAEAADAATAAASVITSVDRAVATAKAIQARPFATDSILAAHGLTRAGLDSLMYDIAADPALARAYTEAMR